MRCSDQNGKPLRNIAKRIIFNLKRKQAQNPCERAGEANRNNENDRTDIEGIIFFTSLTGWRAGCCEFVVGCQIAFDDRPMEPAALGCRNLVAWCSLLPQATSPEWPIDPLN
jgi:hypothetical protein